MAWIHMIPEAEATGRLKELYEKKGIAWIDESNPLKLPRETYLDMLGLGYSYDNIPADKVSVVDGNH